MATGLKRRHWLGGFVRVGANGKPTFIIEKRIRGALFKVSTRRHTEDGAMRELRRFEADPAGYDPAGAVERLQLTPELIMEYRAWMLADPPLGRGNTYDWARVVCSHLFDWLEALAGRDLRRLSTIDIKTMMRTWSASVPGRVVALKGLFRWMRTEKGLVKHAEDATLDVPIPQRGAAKDTATGARDRSFDRVQAVYDALRPDLRDALLLLSATGWHLTELMRFAVNGEIRKDPTGKALATLVFFHKRKERSPTGLTRQEHVEAARRVREKGYTVSRSVFDRAIAKANDALGFDIERVTFGSMRHSVSNWALEDGTDIEVTAKAFNHSSPKMLRAHYLRHAVPRAIISTRLLK